MRLTDGAIARLHPREREYTVWDNHLAGLGVRVRPTGGRSYVLLEDAGGRSRRVSLGSVSLKSVAEVRRECHARKAEPDTAGGPGPVSPLFRDFVEGAWKEAHFEGYKPSTRRGVRSLLDRQLLPAFGSTPLDRLAPAQIGRWFDRFSRPDPLFYIPGAKTPSRLPEILNHEELVRLFTVTTNIKHLAVLMTAYAAGLRVSEIRHLQVTDIDSVRMCLRIDQGKGNKDRYVPLSQRLLAQLRHYWRHHRPPSWLFPSPYGDRPMSRDGAGCMYHNAKRKAGIVKAGGIHTLRHCYATGLLEAGVELPVIQRRLGHGSIRSTMRYLHLAQETTSATPSPLDLLEFPRSVPV